MSTGTKLQAVAQKVYTKLGKQDASLIFRLETEGNRSTIGAITTVTNDDLTITAGCKITFVTAYQIKQPGPLEVGDMRIIIPGNLIPEARIRSKKLIIMYQSERWSVISVRPTTLISGLPVKWEVIARRVK